LTREIRSFPDTDWEPSALCDSAREAWWRTSRCAARMGWSIARELTSKALGGGNTNNGQQGDAVEVNHDE